MELNNCTSQNCLSSLVSLKSACITGDCTPYFIEDLEGVDMTFLANTASAKSLSAEQYAKDVIDTGSRLMMGDLETLMPSGFSLVDAFGEVCSTCAYNPLFQPGGGVVIRNVTGSKFSILRVFNVQVVCNAIGAQNLVFDDGKEIKKFAFNAEGSTNISTVILDYQTKEPIVKLFLENATVGLANIMCETTSGCGCSGGRAPANVAVNYGGYLLGMFTSQQYGFKVCAAVTCSTDVLICSMVKQLPNIFGLTLLYKIGSILYSNAPLSTRNNRNTLDAEEQKDMAAYYESLYQQKLKGKGTTKSLSTSITGYLQQNNDKCVSCNSTMGIAYAVG